MKNTSIVSMDDKNGRVSGLVVAPDGSPIETGEIGATVVEDFGDDVILLSMRYPWVPWDAPRDYGISVGGALLTRGEARALGSMLLNFADPPES